MSKAAVLTAHNQPLEIRTDIEVAPPKQNELKIKIAASGVCHSDLSAQNGTLPLMTPIVLGHEGAGTVVEVGPGVTKFKEGDHVVISWVPMCGECRMCKRNQGYLCDKAQATMAGGLLDGTTRLTSQGAPLFQFPASGTFSEYAIVPDIAAVKIPDDVSMTAASLIGCGVLTGVGAAVNTASIQKGDTVAVIGCGGVGLNVIQGAVIAGAERVIAIDMNDAKLGLAKQFGATDTINASGTDPVSEVMAATGQVGADVAFEVIGLSPTIQQAIGMTRRGGETVLVGVPRMDVMLTVPAGFGLVLSGKTIKGCLYGSSNVHTDVPKLVELYKKGTLKLDELISREIPLEQVNEAFEAMEKGEIARSVITYA